MAGSTKSAGGNRTRSYGVRLVRGPFVKLAPHPDAVESEDELRASVHKFKRPLAADLFCGAGGLSLGLSEAGFDVVLGVDHDKDALETHRALHPGWSTDLDLGDQDVVDWLGALIRDIGVSLVAGGPPCQPFSRAGRSGMRDLVRKGLRPAHDQRRDLWESFLRIVAISKPRAVLMENVPDMALDRDMWILRNLVDELEALGYSVEERVVATRLYGVPQHRTRFILVALADSTKFIWPDPVDTVVTVRNAISDLPPVDGGWRPDNGAGEDPVASGWADYQRPVSGFQKMMRAGVPAGQTHRIYDHITRPVRDDDKLAFEQMDSSTRYSDLDPELRRYRDDIYDDKYKRLDWDDVSRTITAHIAKDGYWYIHPEQDRTLTVREAARIQTFPDHVRFAGPPSAAFRQIGNAVPPALGAALGRAILTSLADPVVDPHPTKTVSALLADWYLSHRPTGVPWLAATTRWQVLHGELLWGRLSRANLQRVSGLVLSLPNPADLLDPVTQRMIRHLAKTLGRDERVDGLLEAARWLVDRPGHIDPPAEVSALRECPGVTPAVAELAVRIVPGTAEDRHEAVLVTSGVLRVAARFFGEDDLESRNRYSDGRLSVARMIGGDDHSHPAHLALVELAAAVCTPTSADCGRCPLAELCVHASESGYQQVLVSPTRGP